MRDCGECTACCEAFKIVELDKPSGQMCSHCTGSGCGIYDQRPDACKSYQCLYTVEDLNEEVRPDRCGAIFDINKKKNRIEVLRVGLVVDEEAIKRQVAKLKREYGFTFTFIDARKTEVIK